MPIKIGVLVPHSNYFPTLSIDLPAALELALDKHLQGNYQLCLETAGYNADKPTLISKIQELLVKHRVDVVTAPLNSGLLAFIKQYFSGVKIPLIVNTLGEDVVFQNDLDPYIFVNSFNLWKSSWLTGYWCGANLGKSACTSAALHDGGYGMSFAFAIGLEAQQGELKQAAVTHRESAEEDPTDVIKSLIDNQPDFLMGLYSGKEAFSFLNAYHHLDSNENVPLIGSSFMVDESILQSAGELALGIQSVSCWRRDTEDDQKLSQQFFDKTGNSLNCYTLMAYETGQLIANAVSHIESSKPVKPQLTEALLQASYKSSRGLLKFDSRAREINTNDYLRIVTKNDDGQLYNRVIEKLETPSLFYEQYDLARKNLTKQGWLNPYLVA